MLKSINISGLYDLQDLRGELPWRTAKRPTDSSAYTEKINVVVLIHQGTSKVYILSQQVQTVDQMCLLTHRLVHSKCNSSSFHVQKPEHHLLVTQS